MVEPENLSEVAGTVWAARWISSTTEYTIFALSRAAGSPAGTPEASAYMDIPETKPWAGHCLFYVPTSNVGLVCPTKGRKRHVKLAVSASSGDRAWSAHCIAAGGIVCDDYVCPNTTDCEPYACGPAHGRTRTRPIAFKPGRAGSITTIGTAPVAPSAALLRRPGFPRRENTLWVLHMSLHHLNCCRTPSASDRP